MSYDISLVDPVTKTIARVPGHLMIGGTYRADYHSDTDTFTPALNTSADLNITYNYSQYYDEIYKGLGIRKIYGLTGLDSVEVLEKMIHYIEDEYRTKEDWITSKRTIRVGYDESGNKIDDILHSMEMGIKIVFIDEEVDWYEGPDDDYWKPTAANALKPLYQLLALAKMRPDCIWNGD